MIKILFLMESLGGGGAERVLVNLVNNMDQQKFDISIITLYSEGVHAEALHKNIHFSCLHKKPFRGIKYLYKFWSKKLLFRKFVKDDYDLVVAYMTGIPTFVAAGFSGRKIAWLHGNYDEAKTHKDRFLSKVNYFGQRRIYDKFDRVVGVSDSVCDSFNKVIASQNKAITLYNTNEPKKIRALAATSLSQNDGCFVITSVGCLEDSKGYDRLIPSVARLKDDGFSFLLQILGEGREHDRLQELIYKLSLFDVVFLAGYQSNPYPYVASSDLFVCSSRTEGLSTAVTEAIILGVPVVSTDVSGAKEILGENNEFGLVVENSEEGIYQGLKKMLSNPELLRHYAVKAKERADFFSTEKTVKAVEDLFEEVCQCRH